MLYSITGISFTYVLISLGMNLARNSTCNMKQSGTKTWRFGCVHCVIFGYHGFETALLSVGEDLFFFFFGLQPTARLKLQYLLNTNRTFKM